MNYFKARRAGGLFRQLKRLAVVCWDEGQADTRTRHDIAAGLARGETPKAHQLREQIAQMLPEADTLAGEMGIDVTIGTLPPPTVGGPVLPVNMLRAIIDPRHGHGIISRDRIEDALNICIGAADTCRRREKWRTFNPFLWLVNVLALIVRIPFLVLRQAGLPPSVEEHVAAQIIKILLTVGIFAMLTYFGIEYSVIDDLMKVLGK